MASWAKYLVTASGFFSVLLGVFHLSLWRIFDWQNELAKLSPVNASIMQMLNIGVAFICFSAAYIAFFHRNELLMTRVGHSLLNIWGLFLIIRALEEFYFSGFNLASVMLATVIGLMAACCIVPSISTRNNPQIFVSKSSHRIIW